MAPSLLLTSCCLCREREGRSQLRASPHGQNSVTPWRGPGITTTRLSRATPQSASSAFHRESSESPYCCRPELRLLYQRPLFSRETRAFCKLLQTGRDSRSCCPLSTLCPVNFMSGGSCSLGQLTVINYTCCLVRILAQSMVPVYNQNCKLQFSSVFSLALFSHGLSFVHRGGLGVDSEGQVSCKAVNSLSQSQFSRGHLPTPTRVF